MDGNKKIKRWKLSKSSGSYRRKVRKVYENIRKLKNMTDENSEGSSTHQTVGNSMEICTNNEPTFINEREGSAGINLSCNSDAVLAVLDERNSVQTCTNHETSFINESEGCGEIFSVTAEGSNIDEDNADDEYRPEYLKEYENKCNYRNEIRTWALKHNISHEALRDLLQILNKTTPNAMPNDPRTLLSTPRSITITIVDSGEYWHNGLKIFLTKNLETTKELPENISVLVNIDGLPIFKSSKQQFWPILCSIFEKPNLSPIICGIYLGSAKPKDLNAYLTPFIDEMDDILQNGLEVNNAKIKVTIKCFVCDSPARAMIKGVCNYNGKHGCLKCTVIGEYSHESHTVIFPDINCPLRTDKDFREKKYGNHHKADSPLLKLPIDMVEAFPVADSLHLIDLGVMKRLLIGWRDGNFGKKDTKWRASDIQTVNNFLNSCKTPNEIHRAVRGLDYLSNWKGSEFRTFFYYLSVVILQKVLKQDAMNHFLTLFCAITICSSEEHFRYLRLAEELLKYYVTHYGDFYGVDYITSNIHNLIHVVDEVRRFGKLENFNAYKFENKLYVIKNLLRKGNKPLAQVAKRLSEYEHIENEQSDDSPNKMYPYVRKNKNSNLLILHFKDFVISTKTQDRYFLNTKQEIMQANSITVDKDKINILCYKMRNLENVFDLPIYSSYLNIFKSKCASDLGTNCLCFPSDVKCKLFAINYGSEIYFFPLLHTF